VPFGLQVDGDPYMPDGMVVLRGEPRIDTEGNTVVPVVVVKGVGEPAPNPFANLIKGPEDVPQAIAKARRRT
jgi:hypothetical protein